MTVRRRAASALWLCPFVLLTFVFLATSLSLADPPTAPTSSPSPPLQERIDAVIAAQAGGELGPIGSDAEFLRRVYLDFAGRIPSVTEARTFLADTGGDKRELLIDRLADSPEYSRHMTEFLHVMLLERMGDDVTWRAFLQTSLEEHKPWDQIVREILDPNSEDESVRGAAFFLTKRLEKYGQNPVDMPGLVRDVGRLFLGVDVQCAECHDHLFVDDYKQQTYQGLFAFLGHTFIRRDVDFPAVGEKVLAKKVDFKSVFIMEDRSTGPKLLDAAEVEIPVLAKGEEFRVAPDRKTRFPGIPTFRPLEVLADQLPRRGNAAFERNIVNRLWWKLMGRGLVEPLDLHHSQNPPSHPEVMALLVESFGQQQFDMKWLLRELARSHTYQRSSRRETHDNVGTQPPSPTSYRQGLERPLSAEQLLASVWQATGTVTAGTNRAATTAAGAESPDNQQLVESKTDAAAVTPNADSTFGSSDELDALREKFKAVLANPPREPEVSINPTVKAALFFMNDDAVLQLLTPRDGNLVSRLAALESADEIAGELYLSVLSRPATEKERAEVADYLVSHETERPAALADLAWALLASTEFCVNH